MKDEKPTSPPSVGAVPKLVAVLLPLSPDDRHRAISAAMIHLGESAPLPGSTDPINSQRVDANHGGGISSKALAWMGKNKITREQLDQIFSIEQGEIDIIASRMPGNSKSKQTVQAYVISGLKSFLKSGDMGFIDKDARGVCQKLGCYDSPNHYNYTKAFKNFITGNKDVGWKLTLPGLAEATKLVKVLTGDAGA